MYGLFNTLFQPTQQLSSQDGAQMHTSVILFLAGLTDSEELIESLYYSRMIPDEIEDI